MEPVYSLEKWCIITVNYNLAVDTIDCVRSLQAAGSSLEQIVVVDNASTDHSPEQLRAEFGTVLTIIESNSNQGYASGLNLGIEHALLNGFDWLLLMNNDTIVDPNFLAALAQAADGNTETLFGPVIFFFDNPEIIWAMGDYRVQGTMFGYNRFLNHKLKPNLPDQLAVDFLNGCCMLVHRDIFERIGVWDTTYYMYGEEVDFCWRAQQAGFRMATVTKAHMLHKVSSSAKRIGSRALYLRVRNQNWFYRRYANPAQVILMALFSFLRNMIYSIKRAWQGQGREAFIPLLGWYDGWFRVKG